VSRHDHLAHVPETNESNIPDLTRTVLGTERSNRNLPSAASTLRSGHRPSCNRAPSIQRSSMPPISYSTSDMQLTRPLNPFHTILPFSMDSDGFCRFAHGPFGAGAARRVRAKPYPTNLEFPNLTVRADRSRFHGMSRCTPGCTFLNEVGLESLL